MPARVKAPAVPKFPAAATIGRRLWTCRAGFEAHLFEELAWSRGEPKMVGPALVESGGLQQAQPSPAFARVGFTLEALVRDQGPGRPGLLDALESTLRGVVGRQTGRWTVQVWVPDSEAYAKGNEVLGAVEARVAAIPGASPVDSSDTLLQVVVLSPALALVGQLARRDALSLAPGGRERMKREAHASSRAALKLEEALSRLALEPSAGDTCVDLGAAPGGWTERLVARGAHVIAVDPANLSPALAKHRKVTHVQASAFAYEPEEKVDWLFCDMAWRPLEVAQLLGKWARRGWADQLVANIKLPMNDKNPILLRVRHTLREAGWAGLEMRQLYHDRDEVTVTAHRAPKGGRK